MKDRLPFMMRIDVKFMLTVGFFIAVLLALSFLFISNNIKNNIISEVENQAKIAFNEIVITRKWSSDYGGVYVEKKEGIQSNPYLEKLGVHPDIEGVNGKIYTLKNPALMTREISAYAKSTKTLEFHITSLDLVNPSNAPDEFETEALKTFEKGATRATKIVERNHSMVYQYMAPLYVTNSCLACHKNYSIGDVRGGISVFLPMDNAYASIADNQKNLFFTAIAVIGAVELLLFFLVGIFISKPVGELMIGVSRISAGQFDYRIPEESKDELGILSESFNKMGSDLRDYMKTISESEERFRKIFDNSYDAICISKKDRIVFANPAFFALFGYEIEDIIGKPIDILLAPGTKEKIKEDETPGVNEEYGTGRYDVIGQTKDGRYLFLEFYKSTMDLKGETYIITIMRDITEHKNAERVRLENERLALATKTKSEFLATMSHELRTPLNSIIGFSELMKERMSGELNEKQTHYVDNVLASSKFLLDLINDILDLSKVEAGKIELVIERISISNTIGEVLILVKERASKHNVLIKQELDPQIDIIEVDKQRFKQVLFNLMSNAIKFSKKEGGTVTIKVKKEGNAVKFSVSDTGIGIREEDMGRMFKTFEQLDSGISRKYEGTGLGLAISKKLVELQGGSITAESKYGVGSTFTFTLPIEAKKEAAK